MEKFILRSGDHNDCDDWVIESDKLSIDLWVEYGSADDDFWQDWADSLNYDFSKIMSTVSPLASDFRNEWGISEDSDFETVIQAYLVLMLTEAIESNK